MTTFEGDRSDRETAAAIAVAMALSMDRAGEPAAAVLEPNMCAPTGAGNNSSPAFRGRAKEPADGVNAHAHQGR